MKEFTLTDINTSFSCYNQFANLYKELKDVYFDTINIKLEKWFGANMSAALGGVLDKLDFTTSINITSSNDGILTILKKNGFLANYGYARNPDVNNTTIKYLKLRSSDSRYFNSYVMNELLSRSDLPEMTEQLKKKIAESIYEIFVNAQLHSKSEYIYTCGQFFPHKEKIEFTIVDMGIGFKKPINNRFNASLSAIQAIKWALIDGNTTKTDVSGGLGLSLLTEFIKLNKGKFQIISDNGFYEVGEEEKAGFLDAPFPGTIVNMEFRTDDSNSYRLSSESDNTDDIF